MADTFLLKPVDLTSTSATTVYTVPTTDDTTVPATASTTSIIKSILVSVAANTTVELLSQPIVANEGDIIKATAATANRLHVLLSVLEIT